MIVEVKAGQSLVDIALQFCGDVDRVVEIAELNGLVVDFVASASMELVVPDVRNVMRSRIEASGAEFCTGEMNG
jgi:hypothetical protein